MKKIFTSLFLCTAIISSYMAQTRYLDPVFDSVVVSPEIQYSSNLSVLLEPATGMLVPTGANPLVPHLAFDLYQPYGDSLTERPLIIYLHTGTFAPIFLNGNPTGSRQDFATTTMCKEYAKRGFVVANIEYRLGWNPNLPTESERATSLMKAVYRAIQDTKSAVRFFNDDYQNNSNSYGIDTSKIVLSGQGSGGWVALGYASLDKLAEIQLPKFLDASGTPLVDTADIGDWDGYGGNPTINMESNVGFSNNIHMVCSMGGGIGDLSWLEAGNVPIAAVHCHTDPVAIYTTGNVAVQSAAGLINITTDISGSYDVLEKQNSLGNNDVLINAGINDAYTTAAQNASTALVGQYDMGASTIGSPVDQLFPFITGNAYESAPWDYWDYNITVAGAAQMGEDGHVIDSLARLTNPDMSISKSLAYIDSTLGYFCPRIAATLGLSVGTNIEELNNSSITVYPNPSNGNLIFSSNSGKIETIKFHNAMGQLTRSYNPNAIKFNINEINLPNGVYLVEIVCMGKATVQKIIIE